MSAPRRSVSVLRGRSARPGSEGPETACKVCGTRTYPVVETLTTRAKDRNDYPFALCRDYDIASDKFKKALLTDASIVPTWRHPTVV